MKKAVIITTICFMSLQPIINAQSTAGVRGGINFSNMFVEEVNDENMKVGFSAGVFVRSYATDLVSLQAEANFTTKGSRVFYDYFLTEGETSFNFNYLEVPFLLGLELGSILRVQGGPYVSFLLGGNVVNESDDDIFDFDEPIDRDDFNVAEFGLAGGAAIGGDGLELGVRYNYGLTDIGKSGQYNGLSYSLRNAHHSVWQAYIAFGF